MPELIKTLGINWKLLLAQALNFLIILAILRLTVYKPLLRVLRERREKIERGLKDAEAASGRMANIAVLESERLAEAEARGLTILSKAEEQARGKEAKILESVKIKERDILSNAERVALAKQKETKEAAYAEAAALIREGIKKTVKLSPAAVDDALIAEAIQELKKSSAASS